MSLQLTVNLGNIERLQQRIQRLAGIDKTDLLDAVGFEVENQTKRRIGSEKQAPDGTPWVELSDDYAAAKPKGDLLELEGVLWNSIQYNVQGDTVQVGSNVVYAAIHQLGGKTKPHRIVAKNKQALAFGGGVYKAVNHPGSDIPARPYLGLSTDNIDDIESILDGFMDAHIEKVLQ